MKHLYAVIVSAVLASMVWAAPTIDGVIDPSEGWLSLGQSQYQDGGGAGANLNEFFYYPDSAREYLFLAFKTYNTASWDVAYGIGLDVDKVTNSGYFQGDNDAWGRKLSFDNLPALEWEFYWWWSGADGAVTSFNSCQWTGSGWNYTSYGTYAYTGDATTGLQALEYKVAFSDLGITEVPRYVLLNLWIAGGDGSSAVDVIPFDPTVWNNDPNEWNDADTLGANTAIGVLEGPAIGSRVVIRPVLNGLRVSADHPVTVTLYRANGQKVLERSVNGFLNLADLERGVYLYRVKGSYETGKVMVLR